MDPSAGQGPATRHGKPEPEPQGGAGSFTHEVPPTGGTFGDIPDGPFDESRGEKPEEPPVKDVFLAAARRLAADLLDLRADALRLIKARRDRVQVRARAIAFQVATLAVLGIFGVVTLGLAAWLMLVGLAGALNALFETAPWVGSLIVGLAVPILTLLAIFLVRRSAEKSQLKALMEEYRELERRRDAHPAAPRPDSAAGSAHATPEEVRR